jgi:REP element-mobilizing transposase RayT
MGRPLAYFLTWTCHGTWLHGDERGSVDMGHNQYGTPILGPDSAREDRAGFMAAVEPRVLSDEERSIVERAIRDHALHTGWELLAVNVRTNHVHVVVRTGTEPERVMGQFKSWATRRLREAGLRDSHRVWTREGSTRYLFDHASVHRAVDYVVNHQ